MAHPSDRHLYLKLSKLVDMIEPNNIRPILETVQNLPKQREKTILTSLLVSRWAESDPQSALAYASPTAPRRKANGWWPAASALGRNMISLRSPLGRLVSLARLEMFF